MTELCEIMAKYGSDKSPFTKMKRQPHNYTEFYSLIFEGERDYITSLLEIGVYQGASLRGWKEYFPKAQIFGIDHKIERTIEEDRIQCLVADQTDEDAINEFLGDRKFDVIIDDGCHQLDKIIETFEILFPRIEEGVYIIEDCKPEHEEFFSKYFSKYLNKYIEFDSGKYDDNLLLIFNKK